MNVENEASAFASEIREREMRHWQQQDAERRRHALQTALKIREELKAAHASEPQLSDAAFESLYLAAVRLYMMVRIEDSARTDHQHLAEALCDAATEAVREVLDGYQLPQAMPALVS